MDYLALYYSLVDLLEELKKNKNTREQAIVITELEKVVAYYKVFVLGVL